MAAAAENSETDLGKVSQRKEAKEEEGEREERCCGTNYKGGLGLWQGEPQPDNNGRSFKLLLDRKQYREVPQVSSNPLYTGAGYSGVKGALF